MVTVIRLTYGGFHDVRCLSTDTKPTDGIKNGSTCLEIDTGKLYVYDESTQTWNEI